LTILGNFGTGKTTFCYKFASELATKFLKDCNNNRIPFLIIIHDHPRVDSIKGLIQSALEFSGISYESFIDLHGSGKLVLILDGFDELIINTDRQSVLQTFLDIKKLIHNKAKIILTSRTHYFKTDSDVNQAVSTAGKQNAYFGLDQQISTDDATSDVVELLELDEGKIEAYLLTNFGASYEREMAKIRETYNLLDLARRPILLDLIVRALPQLDNTSRTITSLSLYDTYTRLWIDRESWRLSLDANQVLELMEAIAVAMLELGTFSINFSELQPLIKKFMGQDESISKQFINMLDQQIRTGTFLNRDSVGNYQFLHRSFLEYFLARRFAKELFSFDFYAIRKHIEVVEKFEAIEQFYCELISELIHESTTKNKLLKRPVQCGEMVLVPGGKCWVGDVKYNNYQQINVDPFYIDIYPVTNIMYKKFIDVSGYRSPYISKRFARWFNWEGNNFPASKGNHPVVLVTWYDAFIFSLWNGKRLPVSNEWEKAARGPNGQQFPWGDKLSVDKCNVPDSFEGETTPIDKYSTYPSPYGCLDMVGNVWEWLDDYKWAGTSLPSFGSSPSRSRSRLIAGSAWGPNRFPINCSYREYVPVNSKAICIGFRCARDPEEL
jgi:formylglycine-generating enzyme required for sulfatase activity